MESLIVLNKDEATVSFIDALSGVTESQVDVDENPHEVAVTRDGSTSYVTNSGGNTVSVLDNARAEEVKRIRHPDFAFPHGVGLSADESEVFIASTRAGRVFVIDVQTHEVTEIIRTYQRLPHMIYPDPEREKIYIPNIGSDNITILDAASRRVLAHIPVGSAPEGAGVHPDGRYLYVAHQGDDDFWVIDLGDDDYSRVARGRLGTCPIRLVFSPDWTWALVPNRESNDLSVIDCGRLREIKRVPTGIWPGGTVFHPDGHTVYVANNKTNDISVIDVEFWEEIDRFRAGIHPDGMAFAQIS